MNPHSVLESSSPASDEEPPSSRGDRPSVGLSDLLAKSKSPRRAPKARKALPCRSALGAPVVDPAASLVQEQMSRLWEYLLLERFEREAAEAEAKAEESGLFN